MKNVRVSRFYDFRDYRKVSGFSIDITLDKPIALKNSDDFLPQEIICKLKQIIALHEKNKG